MKQFLIVLFSLALVVFGYVFYRDSGEQRPQAPGTRPDLQTGRGRTGNRPDAGRFQERKFTTPKGEATAFVEVDPQARVDAETVMDQLTSSWRDLVADSDVIPIEEAWGFDLTGVDFDADPLLTLEAEDGERIEITRDEWRKYTVLTAAHLMLEADLLEAKARSVAQKYEQPYGFTDEVWDAFFAAWCKGQGKTVEGGRQAIAALYGLPVETAMRTRRQQVESTLAYFPTVTHAEYLPDAVRSQLEEKGDDEYAKFVLGRLAEARQDLNDPDHIALILNVLEPLSAIFAPVLSELEFRHDWSYLDGNMPDDAVVATFVGDVQTGELLPPWLQPVGEVFTVGLEDAWQRVNAAEDLDPAIAQEYLRHVIWNRVLRRQLERQGALFTPEEQWMEHAEDYLERKDTLMTVAWLTDELYEYPSVPHYRSVMGVYRAFLRTLPEGWDSDENLRDYYERNRVFIEKWQPSLEVILFPPRDFRDDPRLDWDRARREAEEARTRVLAGDVEFSTLRTERDQEMFEDIVATMGEGEGQKFRATLGGGELNKPVAALQIALKEKHFARMMNLTSVVRNAVARLERKEISPVWKGPLGYYLLRVNGVGLVSLEGEYEDHEFATEFEYKYDRFYHWANDALTSTRVVVTE